MNYNGISLIERCLSSVLNSTYLNFEIIFVDNASTDGSINFVTKKFGYDSRLKIVQCKENLGFAQGNNIGELQAKGKYLIFLNTDTEVAPSWLTELLNVMEIDQTIGAAQSKLLMMGAPQFFDGAGDIMDYYGSAFPMARGEKDNGQYDFVKDIFSARGAAFIVRRSIFEDVGMFDPNFVSFLEDVDLSWRIWLNGYRIVFVPRSIVYHLGGATLKKLPKSVIMRSQIRSRRNQVMMMIKNYELKNVIKYVPVRVIINGFIILSISIINPIDAKNVLKDYKSSLNLKDIWTERLRVQYKIRKVPDTLVMEHMLYGNLAYLASFIVNCLIYGENYATKTYFFRQRKNRGIDHP